MRGLAFAALLVVACGNFDYEYQRCIDARRCPYPDGGYAAGSEASGGGAAGGSAGGSAGGAAAGGDAGTDAGSDAGTDAGPPGPSLDYDRSGLGAVIIRNGVGVCATYPCSTPAAAGAVINLSVNVSKRYYFRGWDPSGPCAAFGAEPCMFTHDGGQVAVRVEVSGPHNFAFVAAVKNGAVDGGDDECTRLGQGLVDGGTFYALKSSSLAMLDDSRGWLRSDGRPFLDLLAPDAGLFYPLDLDSSGVRVTGVSAFTGLATISTGAGDCDGFTTASGTTVAGVLGASDYLWLDQGAPLSCGVAGALYCFETGSSVPLLPLPPPRGARVVYVSDALVQSNGARTQCPGATPVLATTTVKVEDVLRSAGLRDLYRADGLLWLGRTESVALPRAALDVQRDGGRMPAAPERVWVGAVDAITTASAAESCGEWMSAPSSQPARIGEPHHAQAAFSAGVQPCNSTARVYCVEQR